MCETMCWELGKRDMSGVITIGQSVVTGGRKGHRREIREMEQAEEGGGVRRRWASGE